MRPGKFARLLCVLFISAVTSGVVGRDVNNDGILDVADVIALEGELATDPALPIFDDLDLNQDSLLDFLDVRALVRRIIDPSYDAPVDLDITFPPRERLVTSNSNLEIIGSVDQSATLSLNGIKEVENFSGDFRFDLQLTPGLNIVEVSAESTATGSLARQSSAVYLDLTPPAISLLNPPDQSALPGDLVRVEGTVSDQTSTVVSVTSTGGMVTADVDAFGRWAADVPVLEGLNTIEATAVDEAGLINSVSIQVRSFISPEQTAESPLGAKVMLPEGAFPKEDMAVSLHDATTEELESILGMDLLSVPPKGGLEGLPKGAIIMPNAMMLEIENPPDNGDPLFRKEAMISIPNVTGADNTMPIWIFQVQPDSDGDGEAQLSLVSRGRVSDDGMTVVPVTEMMGPVDGILPGFMNPANRRFEEDEFVQIEDARAVRDLQARMRGQLAHNPDPAAKNRLSVYPKHQVLASPLEPAGESEYSIGTVERSSRRQAGLLVDDFEDGDLVNLLQPPNVTYTAFNPDVSDPSDPITPEPLLADDIPDMGNPARRQPPPQGKNGGVPLSGSFLAGVDLPQAEIVTGLLGGSNPLNLAGAGAVEFRFDARSDAPDALYEVTIEDSSGTPTFIEFEPEAEWQNFTYSLGEFSVNPADLQSIVWRIRGTDETNTFQIQIDNPEFLFPGATPPPPTFVPTPTFTDPTPPPPTPTATTTPSPIPTGTPPPRPTTGAGSASPSPTQVFATPTPDTIPTTDAPSPTATPDGNTPKTQVTFYCCAASALMPFVGNTDCDDDENVDQQRLQDCIRETLNSYITCQQNVRRMLAELNGTVDGMEKGYDTLFGTVTINGKKVPLIVNGSLFQSFPWGTGAGKAGQAATQATQAVTNLAQTAANGVSTLQALDAAQQSGDRQGALQAVVDGSSQNLNSVVTSAMLLNDVGATPGLESRKGFGAAFTVTNVLSNIYKTVNAGKGYIEGFYLAEPLAEAIDLEGNRCARLFNRLRDLRKCNKGSNVWLTCVQDPEAREWSDEHQLPEDILYKLTVVRQAIKRQQESVDLIKDFGELNMTTMEVFTKSMNLSVAIEEGDDLTDEEFFAMVDDYRASVIDSSNGFLLLAEQLPALSEAMDMAAESEQVFEMVREFTADATTELDNMDEMNDEGSKGSSDANVQIAGQPSSSAVRSGEGGSFVAYKHATVRRVGDTVTFEGSDEQVDSTMNDTLFGGSAMTAFPDLEYEFTPFSTFEFDEFVEVGPVPMAIGIDDRNGIPPTVDITFPTDEVTLRSGFPFILRGSADDDVVVFSTRFQIDGTPSEALGSNDSTTAPSPYEFFGWFLGPEPEAEKRGSILMVDVFAEAIDAGGNIGQSDTVTITFDPDAPLLVEVDPPEAITSAGGENVMFTATIADGGASLPSPLWFVEGIRNGNDRVGTISDAGLYRPPSDGEHPVSIYQVQVLSETQPELFGAAQVTVTAINSASITAAIHNTFNPQAFSGKEYSAPLSAFNDTHPSHTSGKESSHPISISNTANPQHTSGKEATYPVTVENSP